MPVFLLLAVLLIIVAFFLMQRVPCLPNAGDWGAVGSDDPRVAVAGMMYSVATEDGPLTAEERHIIAAAPHQGRP